MPSLYVFVSTASSAGITDEAIHSVQSAFGANVPALCLGQSGQYWSNGFVFRLHSSSPPSKFREWVRGGLEGIAEFWLMHDGRGNAVDNMSSGPGLMALQKLGSRSLCQLFVRYDPSDDRKSERVVALLQDFEKHGVTCKYAFGFNDGCAYFLASLQTSRTIFRRCEGHLRLSVPYVLIDPMGDCYGPQGDIDHDAAWIRFRPVSRGRLVG